MGPHRPPEILFLAMQANLKEQRAIFSERRDSRDPGVWAALRARQATVNNLWVRLSSEFAEMQAVRLPRGE